MLVLLSNHVEILSRSLLASFLDCVGKAGRYASSFAPSHRCGAGEVVLNLVVVRCWIGPRHGIAWIAARAIVNGSIAAPAAL